MHGTHVLVWGPDSVRGAAGGWGQGWCAVVSLPKYWMFATAAVVQLHRLACPGDARGA